MIRRVGSPGVPETLVYIMRSLLLIGLLAMLGMASAQEAVTDAPGRAARLSLIEGSVTVAPAGTEEWAEAILNRPLTSGDRLFVESAARAELQFGSGRVHLDQNTGMSIIEMDDDVMRLELSEGTALINVQRLRDGERIEIETPNATVALLHPGEYRIEAAPSGDRSIVATRHGGSEVTSPSGTWRVDAGNEMTFVGTTQLESMTAAIPQRSAFEDWANERNRESAAPTTERYVSSEVVGYEDLERHGRWVSEPSYGHVWYPSYVAAGWAPYRYGRWVWVAPWGWSWVDNAPWGFAPFHYGRWAYVRSRWCWVPGPRYVRPVYAPALVAWSGTPGFSVSVGIGTGIGWFPLAPREVYVPGYRYSRRYLNNVNVSNTVIVNNTYITNVYNGRHRNFDYRYARHPHAVTVVDRDRFRGGRDLSGQWTRLDENALRRREHQPRPPALTPNRESVFAARTLGRIPGSPDHVVRETFDRDRGERNRPGRMSFDAERRAVEANGGRPVSRSQLRAAQERNLAAPGALQTSPQERSESRPWKERERTPAALPAQQLSRDQAREQRARAANEDARDRPRQYSDRPAWSRRESNDRVSAPQANGLQPNRPGAAPSVSDRSREMRGNFEQRQGQRSWSSTGQRIEPARSEPRAQPSRPQSRIEPSRQSPPRVQPQMQPPPQQRSVQPRQEAPRAAPAPQRGNANSGSFSRPRSDGGGGRPSLRVQER